MNSFRYIVQDQDSKTVEGRIQASTVDEAAGLLQNKGYLILTIAEDNAAKGKGFSLSFLQAPGDQEMVDFSRDLGMLLRGGIPAMRALGILSTKSRNPKVNEGVIQVAKNVAKGRSLSVALSEQSAVFPPLLTTLVKVGEESGQLIQTLAHFTSYAERQLETRRKVIHALTYPLVVVSFAMGVTVFICMKVVPTFAKIFASLKVPMPAATKAVLFVSAVLLNYWFLGILLAVGFGFLWRFWVDTEAGKAQWANFKLGLPILGQVFADSALEKMFSTLALLLKSGVSMMVALQNLAQLFGENPKYSAAVQSISVDVARGSSLAMAMRKTNVFPEMAPDSVEVSEEAGTLVETLETLGRFHSERLDSQTRQMATLLEPFMVAIIGLIVGFIMFALFIPMLEMTNIRPR